MLSRVASRHLQITGVQSLQRAGVRSMSNVSQTLDQLAAKCGEDVDHNGLLDAVAYGTSASTLAAASSADSALLKSLQEGFHAGLGRKLKAPVNVVVSGAGDVHRMASGSMLGYDQPFNLTVHGDVDVKGLEAASFPLLKSVKVAKDLKGFKGADYALIHNVDAETAVKIGQAINSDAKSCLTLCSDNTTALIIACNAADVPTSQFAATPRSYQSAAESMMAAKADCSVSDVTRAVIWGKDYIDVNHSFVQETWAKRVLDLAWVRGSLQQGVQEHEVDAGAALVDSMRDWAQGTNGEWCSLAVSADGAGGIGHGHFFSVPVVCEPGQFKRIGNVNHDPYTAEKLNEQLDQIKSERAAVMQHL